MIDTTRSERMTAIWHRHRLKIIGGSVIAWVLFITLVYQDVKRSQRAGPAGAEELLQIGALPVT
ncbi:MAG: hypothetical protein M3O61_03100 [Gemmatimonadota bacterium]|nr:hypothetical protein [Gemmatimonadota bacterium]